MKKRLSDLKDKTLDFIRRRYKSILYYCAVALALALVASAAESYRTDREGGQPLILQDYPVEEAVSDAAGRIIYPDNMRLLRSYSSLPEWNAELKQWEIHAANDYVFSDDTVHCLEDGMISDTGENSLRGNYIEVESPGRIYIYSGVQAAEDVQPGKEVSAGDIIGFADNSMPSEKISGRHLHLEVYNDGVLSDFEQIYGKKRALAD